MEDCIGAYPPSGSEDENFDDSDDDPDYRPTKDITEFSSEVHSLDKENDDFSDVEPSYSIKEKVKRKNEIKENKQKLQKIKKHTQVWAKISSNSTSLEIPKFITEKQEDKPEIGRPIHYFNLYFDKNILNHIIFESNRYSIQKNPNKPLNLDEEELEIFLGIVIYRSIYGLPRTRMYWAKETRIPKVADAMSRDKWEIIKSFLHFTNNEENVQGPDRDRLFKIRPLVSHLSNKFKEHTPTPQMTRIDEQVVPFRGRSSLKQYNPKKPSKWGYKIFELCYVKGLIYNFEIYTGQILPVEGKPDIGASGNIVLKLSEVIPNNKNHLLYFDNWFSSPKLMTVLHKSGIGFLGTIRTNRLPNIELTSDQAMKKIGRGVLEEFSTKVEEVEIRVVKWFDNKAVTLASTFCGAHPIDTIKRFSKKDKRHIDVTRPNIVKQYNSFMGGVDLLDGLISYHRIYIRSKKWYLRIFFHFIDMVLVAAWVRYQEDMLAAGIAKKDILDLLGFRSQVSEALCMIQKSSSKKKRGRPSFSNAIDIAYEQKKRKDQQNPYPS